MTFKFIEYWQKLNSNNDFALILVKAKWSVAEFLTYQQNMYCYLLIKCCYSKTPLLQEIIIARHVIWCWTFYSIYAIIYFCSSHSLVGECIHFLFFILVGSWHIKCPFEWSASWWLRILVNNKPFALILHIFISSVPFMILHKYLWIWMRHPS